MSEFDPIIEAQLDGAVVRAAHVATFDFRTEPMRLWPGFGDLDLSGLRFQGIGKMGTISPIVAGPGGAAEEVTATLFGDEELLEDIEGDATASIGRELTIGLQFFDLRQTDASGNWVEWQPLGPLLTMFVGRMGPLTITRQPPGDGSSATRTVSVSALNILLNRARPAFQFFSDRDQKSRTDGTDNMFLRVSQYSEGTARWPQF